MNMRLRQCPVCNQTLEVTEYHCPSCDVTIRGRFGLGELASLTPSQQEFVKVFLCSGGNIKEVEKRLGISYPTVKSRLAEITDQICQDERQDYNQILNDVASGQISVAAAVKQLNKRRSE